MSRSDRCATCGRPRGLEQIRPSFSIHPWPHVPRTDNPDDQPYQVANDLICHVTIYRNGGYRDDTHLCNECLRIGLRAIKLEIDKLLGELDADHDKDDEIAKLTERLHTLQHRHYNVCFDHDRMQGRLAGVLQLVPDDARRGAAEQERRGIAEDVVSMAEWEVKRGKART